MMVFQAAAEKKSAAEKAAKRAAKNSSSGAAGDSVSIDSGLAVSGTGGNPFGPASAADDAAPISAQRKANPFEKKPPKPQAGPVKVWNSYCTFRFYVYVR